MSTHRTEIDQQVAYSLDEARRHLAHGDRRRAADELRFAAERAVDERQLSDIRQLAGGCREKASRFGRGRWDDVLATLDRRTAETTGAAK
jgi:hypothetical protein